MIARTGGPYKKLEFVFFSEIYLVTQKTYTLKSQKNWYRHAYANKEKWNQSEYGAAVGNAYIRQQVSGTVVRSVTAATMAGYQDLSEFERGVKVGAREMRHSISEVAMEFVFSRTAISRMYREYRESGKTSNLRHRCGRKKIIQERDGRESLNATDVQPFRKLLQISMPGHQQVSACEPFNETSSIWAFGAEGPLVYP
ncbi:hypothetical protein AVEN_119435-1 [Araneus ventricosus]|uniref:Tc3 transposase DNA binding domain-containing protein n=1 Tax=Araneus ventricosus TaxID=182803 RepID=A0A4Y2DKW6_ARAVE|nr:hypothetical protein AVEN_119435-1 [Araneus ventricosus]